MSKPLIRAIEYYVVDAVTFAGNIFLAWALVEYGDVQYLIATAAGFLFQTVVAFFANKAWTFHKRHLRVSRGLLVTTTVQLSALAIAVGGTAFGVEVLGWSFLVARIVAGAVAGLWGYIMDSRFTFGISPLR